MSKKYMETTTQIVNTNVGRTRSIAQSAGAVEYTDCFSAEGYNPPPPKSVLYMTLKNLIIKYQ